MRNLFLVPLVAMAGLAQAGSAKPTFSVQQREVLGGTGRWDYLAVEPKSHRLFISRSDRVMVLDAQSLHAVGEIPGTDGVHGIAFAPDLQRGYTSNGRGDSVTMFDLATLKSIATVPVQGHNPDAILYDAASHHLFTFNGRSHDASILDPKSGSVIATLALGGKPEFAATDRAGHVYVNIEDTAEIVSIDTKKNQVAARWKLDGCEEPSGLAFDLAHHRLFSTCQNGAMPVTDSQTGHHVTTIPIGQGPDAALYDAERGLVFSSNGEDGTLTIAHQDDPDHYSVVDTLATQKSARTLTIDSATHRLYSVAASFGAVPAPTAQTPKPRAEMLPDSFTVLSIGER